MIHPSRPDDAEAIEGAGYNQALLVAKVLGAVEEACGRVSSEKAA